MKNRINFIFNAHLPFVRHPEYPRFLEEDWLFEAMNESYIPLLRMMYKLRDEKVPFKFAFSISPTLVAMLSDSLLQQRFKAYLESRMELGALETSRVSSCGEFNSIVKLYNESLEANLAFYEEQCESNILNAFTSLANEGYLELVTSAATYAFLPVFRENPVAVNAQIETGLIHHLRSFDRLSEGFWLPDCGYYPGLDELLRHHNVRWTVVAAQAFTLSDSKPERGNYSPVVTENGLYCFARNYSLLSKVLSQNGYTSDPVYREFYRDIGYDLPIDYIRPYIHEPEIRVFTGFKYWSITGNTSDKVPYNPQLAEEKTKIHAADFLKGLKEEGEKASNYLDFDPVFTLSFEAELFGHRWFEGIKWIENFVKLVAKDDEAELVTPTEIINLRPDVQVLSPAFSSAAAGGFSQDLVDNNSNAWLLRYLFESIERMTELANRFPNQKSLKQRFLNQAARETLLLMSSDWPMIIHNNTCSEYAKKRIVCHTQSINLVYDNMCRNAVNTEWLVRAEKSDNLFGGLDYNCFNSDHLQVPSKLFTTEF